MHLAGLLSRTRLTFVRKEHVTGDVYTFYFAAPQPLKYHIAGQHGIFVLSSAVRAHPFSLLNAPEEEYVMIGTHVRKTSAFKQRLSHMKPGDPITLFGGFLDFTLEGAGKQAVFLANGIGITPFRSMLVHADRAELPVHITLIHVDGDTPAYRAETEQLAEQAFYPADSHEFGERLRDTIVKQPDATYYISGSPAFVSNTKAALREHDIEPSSIKTDGFWGY